MFAIGSFAQIAKVSVRTLRHYDDLGLLRPAHTNPVSGYRYHRAAQLSRLNQIVALKDLGFSLTASDWPVWPPVSDSSGKDSS
jgi:DNA-binding transcriptional MerR regulator